MMLRTLAFAATLVASTAAINNTIFVISNAEQPSLFRPGLTPVGVQRATECLPQLFADKDIGKIISCPKNEESAVCFETLATAQPIADALGLPIDTSCGADENTDDDCVTGLTKKFAKNSTQNILIVWDFFGVGALLEQNLDLDTDPADAVDGIHYDVVVEVVRSKIRLVTSQNCTNLDGEAPSTARRSLSPAQRRERSLKRREAKKSRRNSKMARSMELPPF
ncbi:hypothetical protein CVT24_010363 [Panaeolus cyanescens]|uniref:Uncharacterized protein n=1 Tax=Panaeolus cyanescens TaxID=181874 RepID=A0A409VAI7_9AGAR|nr:hypothetical protein CVT24_010363 [Panaeolus cyanescens]